MHAVDSMRTGVAAWLPAIAGALVIAGIAVVLGRIVMDPVAKRFGDPAHGRMVGRFAAVIVWGLGAAAALSWVGVPASITLPILVTVLVIVGAVLVVLLGPRLPRLGRRRDPGLSLIEGEDPALRGQCEAYQRGRADALRIRQLPHDSRRR